jgi:hypothetical protein
MEILKNYEQIHSAPYAIQVLDKLYQEITSQVKKSERKQTHSYIIVTLNAWQALHLTLTYRKDKATILSLYHHKLKSSTQTPPREYSTLASSIHME